MSKRLSAEYVTKLNRYVIETYSPNEIIGVKEPALLDSAINAPFQTMFGEFLYPDIYQKAVALLKYLAKNHPFHNANKRTAVLAMAHYLFINGNVCVMHENTLSDLVVDIVTENISFEDAVSLIKKSSYRK